jgi:predicted DNA-binding transcriptional regulator YafY
MNVLISKAISEMRLIQFHYKGAVRTVEPHSYGMQVNGSDALCGWQRSGGSGQEFRLFRGDEIEMLHLMDENFPEPRTGYRRRDSRFSVTYVEL